MTRVFNKAGEKDKRRKLRGNMPLAEVILWDKLKNRSLNGHRFRRQYSVGKFVIDFYCPKKKLAIELDGESHFSEGADVRDKERQSIIEDYGINFLRFTNQDIYENLAGVLSKISDVLERKD